MKKLLTMCSSHRRYDMLERMIKSWKETVHGEQSVLVIYVDEKNPHIDKYKKLALPRKVSIEYGPYKSMVRVLNYFSCEQHRDFDYYSEVNDDHVFVTEGWDIKMMEAIDRKNAGVAIAYGQSQNLPTATMHGALLVRELGYFFPPEYKHSWVDIWLNTIGRKTNILTHVSDVLIEHRHPAFGKASKDETYQGVEDDYNNGRKIFETWMADGYEKDCLKLSGLINRMRIVNEVTVKNISEHLTVLMTTYNRYEVLEQTIKSYLKVQNRPARLYVFDDMSDDQYRLKALIMRVPEALLIQDSQHVGCYEKTVKSLRTLFEAGAENVLVLDSDCLFSGTWWERAQEIVRDRNKEDIYSLFNTKLHPVIEEMWGAGLVRKSLIGGLGMIISKQVWSKYLKDYHLKNTNWDGWLCNILNGDGHFSYSCVPSELQHIGNRLGTHCDIDCVAEDFIGEVTPTDFEMAHPFKLRYIGEEEYLGFDDNGNKEIRCKTMDIVFMSRDKARQLLSDFPSAWVYVSSVTEESLW